MSQHWPAEAEVEWERDGMTFALVNMHKLRDGAQDYRAPWNGYVHFVVSPLQRTSGYEGILTYVPVHGGITYGGRNDDGSATYGFDCAHGGDEKNPDWHDIERVKAETERMGECIRIAASYEEPYERAWGNEEKAAVLDEFHSACNLWGEAEFDLSDNLGAMIHLLGGEL